MIKAMLCAAAVLVPAGACVHAGRPQPSAAIDIAWDQWQVPHVYAPDREGIARGLGWAQLRAYPDEILRLYALGRGEAAAIWGPDSLRSDRLMRTLGVPRLAREAFAKRSPEIRAELEAFARGMNEFAAAHPERLSPESRLVLPVRPEDPLAHGHRILLAFTLLTGQRPLVISVDGEIMPALAGSNAWAIAPSRSASGHAMLLANPHLPWGPAALRFFEAHLVGPDAPIYGCMLLGFPGISIGFTDAIAWSHTVNVIDTADFYTLVPEGAGYRYDGRERAWDEHTENVGVRGADGVVVEQPLRIRRSVHGPVIELQEGQLVAVRTGLDESSGGWLDTWAGLGRARNLAEFEDVLREVGLPMFNVVYADREGHILFLSAGRVPRRPELPGGWRMPVPGDSSTTLWTELLPYAALPRVVDPSAGFVQNSNSVPWFATLPGSLDPSAHAALGIPAGPLLMREIHGLRMLTGDDSITFDELRTMRHSARLELADHVLDDLLVAANASDSPSIRAAAALLAAWDRHAGSPGSVLFEAWAERAFAKHGFAEAWSAVRPLDTPRGLADKPAALADLAAAITELEQRHGTIDPAWGDVHRLRDDLPGVGASGDLGSFHVMEYAPAESGGLRPVAGDTFVAIVELAPEGPRAEVLLTYGNASAAAPFAADQLALMAARKLRTPLLDRTAITAGAVETLRLK